MTSPSICAWRHTQKHETSISANLATDGSNSYYEEPVLDLEPEPPVGRGDRYTSSDENPIRLDGGDSSPVGMLSPVQMLNQEYKHLGSINGRQERAALWRQHERQAAAVLVARARFDEDLERLAEAAEILADLGQPGLEEAINGLLDDQHSDAYIETLLRALRWSSAVADSAMKRELAERLERLLSEDDDIGEAAIDTIVHLLPIVKAREILERQAEACRGSTLSTSIELALQRLGRMA